MSLQEVPQTELQPLSTVAKSAAALLKYLPLPAALLPRATATLSDGVRATLWPTRAAALVFAQVQQFFWPEDGLCSLSVKGYMRPQKIGCHPYSMHS